MFVSVTCKAISNIRSTTCARTIHPIVLKLLEGQHLCTESVCHSVLGRSAVSNFGSGLHMNSTTVERTGGDE